MLWARRRLRWREASKPSPGFGPINHLAAHRLPYRHWASIINPNYVVILISCNIFQLKSAAVVSFPISNQYQILVQQPTPVYAC